MLPPKDTLADAISEAISRALCRFYLDEFGQIQHHNVDKVLIIAGQSAPCYSGGSIKKPPAVVVGGRASRTTASPLADIVREATASHLKKTLKHLELFDVEPRLEVARRSFGAFWARVQMIHQLASAMRR